MSNQNEQNGRPPPAERVAPPTDPRIRNTVPPASSEASKICRDFIWGRCLGDCKYRHELEYESMKAALRFCHDFQNRTGCTRPDCTYLHTSREEENKFLTTGQIPQILADRYAAMAMRLMPPPPPPPPNGQGVPPPPPQAPCPTAGAAAPEASMTTFPSGAITTSIPGPTPMGLMTTNAQMSTPMNGPLPTYMNGPMVGPMNSPLASAMPVALGPAIVNVGPVQMNGALGLPMNGSISPSSSKTPAMMSSIPTILEPPPPPPPLPPPAVTTASIRPAPISTMQYPASPVHQLSGPFPQKQPIDPVQLPCLFDPSRPPPPLPTRNQMHIPQKRPSEQLVEAGQGKKSKTEGGIGGPCDHCVQTELRIKFYIHEVEKLQREIDYMQKSYEKKNEEYQNGLRLLQSFVKNDVAQLLNSDDSHMGSSSTILNDVFSSPLISSPTYSETPPARNVLVHLMNTLANSLASTTRNTKERSPPLESINRRPQSANNEIATLLDILKTVRASAPENRAPGPDMNGLGRLIQHEAGPSTSGAAYPLYEEKLPSPAPSVAPVGAPMPVPAPYVTYPQQAPPYHGHYATPPTNMSYMNPGPPVTVAQPTSVNVAPYAQYSARLQHHYYQTPFQ